MTSNVVDFFRVLALTAGSILVGLIDKDFDSAALTTALFSAFFLNPLYF